MSVRALRNIYATKIVSLHTLFFRSNDEKISW